MLVALYARVSTEDQSCELQLREMREYCSRRGWAVFGEYVDTGWSGAKASRPQLDKLLKAASQHRFDCVMVWKLDRFGRSVANFVQHMQNLDQWGVRFMAITQTIDTDQASPTSRLLIHLMAAFAEFERAMIQERVRAGMKAAKARGVHCGRRRLVFDRDKAVELRLRGKSFTSIGKELGTSFTTIQRLFASRR